MVFLSYELPPKKNLSYFMTDLPILFFLKKSKNFSEFFCPLCFYMSLPSANTCDELNNPHF